MPQEHATLVVGPRWIGDIVMAQVLFAALKETAPDRPIDVIAPEWSGPLAKRMPEVREWIESPFPPGPAALAARVAMGRRLRGRYDRAYVLPRSWKSALVPLFAGIPRRTGYRGEMRYGLLNDMRVIDQASRLRTAESFFRLADASGPMPLPSLSVDRANQHRLLAKHAPDRQPYAVVAPGAQYPAKIWPSQHFVVVARHFAANGIKPLILGSPGDRSTGERIVGAVDGALNLCGETGVADALDIIGGARLAVTNDSGLMHVAAAVGTPLVAIFGSSSAENTPPLSPRAETVRLGLSCSPCLARTCPLGHTNCLVELHPRLVLDAAARLGAI